MNCGMRMCILCGGKKKLCLRGYHHACTGLQDNWFKITNKKYVKFALYTGNVFYITSFILIISIPTTYNIGKIDLTNVSMLDKSKDKD